MLAQTVSKNCIKKPLSTRFRIGVIGGLMLAVCMGCSFRVVPMLQQTRCPRW